MLKTPASILVVSILGILYSALIVLGVPVGAFMMYHPMTPNPAMDALTHDASYMTIYLISAAFNFCLGVLLLASAIGSLKLRPWARKGMLVYACGHIVISIVGTIVTFIFVLPRMTAVIGAMPGPGADIARVSMIAGGILGLLFSLAVAAVILIVFNLRRNVDAFHGIFPVEPANFPVQFPPPLPPETR